MLFFTFQFSVGRMPSLCAEKWFFLWSHISITQKPVCWSPNLPWGQGPALGLLIQSVLTLLARGPHLRPLG